MNHPANPNQDSGQNRRAGLPGRWVVVVLVLAGVPLIPVVMLLTRPDASPESKPLPPTPSLPTPARPLNPVSNQVAETIREATDILRAAGGTVAEGVVLQRLQAWEGSFQSAQGTFEALPESERGPVQKVALRELAALNAAADGVYRRPGASRWLRMSVREVQVNLGAIAAGGYRIEDVLETAYGQAGVLLEKRRSGTVSEQVVISRLRRYSDQVGQLVPAYDALEEANRARVSEAARLQLKEFSGVADTTVQAQGASRELKDLVAGLLNLLREFARQGRPETGRPAGGN